MTWIDRLRSTTALAKRLLDAKRRRDEATIIRLIGLMLKRDVSDEDRFLLLNERGRAKMDSGDYAGSLPDHEAALTLMPGDAATWSNLGIALYQLGRETEAIPALEKAVAFEPRADTFLWLAICRFYDGEPDRAIAALDQAARLDPADARAWRWRGYVRRAWEPEGALQDYARALALDPEDRNSRLARANILARLQRPQDAVAEYDRLLDGKPDDPNALRGRGGMKKEAGDLEGALADYGLAHQLMPASLDIGFAMVDVHHALGRIGQAIEIATQDAVAAPGSPPAMRILAYAHRLAGQFDESLALIDQALERVTLPSYRGELIRERAQVLADAQRDEEAEETLARLDGEVERHPFDVALRLSRAETRLLLGHPHLAREDARRILEIDPYNGAARALLESAAPAPD